MRSQVKFNLGLIHRVLWRKITPQSWPTLRQGGWPLYHISVSHLLWAVICMVVALEYNYLPSTSHVGKGLNLGDMRPTLLAMGGMCILACEGDLGGTPVAPYYTFKKKYKSSTIFCTYSDSNRNFQVNVYKILTLWICFSWQKKSTKSSKKIQL